MQALILFCVLTTTYLLVINKRMPALIRSFRYQSFFLFLSTLVLAFKGRHFDLYVISGLILALKVAAIPYFLFYIIKRVKVNESVGLFINAQLSLLCVLVFTYLAWVFSCLAIPSAERSQAITLAVSLSVTSAGMFIMIFRMNALAQIIGILVMENGLFLLASSVSGGMPFFVEIAIFFDVFVSVVILGLFVYRINKLFTHIDVRKLSRLRG